MKELKLSSGKVALVDDEDYDYLMQWKWWTYKGTNTLYAKRVYYIPGGKGKIRKTVFMHRLILGLTDPEVICDHADRNGLNNQRSNLRVATRSQNRANSKPSKNGTSIYLGVMCKKFINKNDEIRISWFAQIGFNGKTIGLGYFDNETDAAKAYDIKAKELFKEFANLNFK